MPIEHQTLVLFSDEELSSADTEKYILAPGFGEKLKELRLLLGRPMVLNSAARSKAYNRAIRGHPRSLHVYDDPYWATGGCCAVDVGTTDGQYRHELIKLALQLEWSVGVASSFIHLDRRVDYINRPAVVFTY